MGARPRQRVAGGRAAGGLQRAAANQDTVRRSRGRWSKELLLNLFFLFFFLSLNSFSTSSSPSMSVVLWNGI